MIGLSRGSKRKTEAYELEIGRHRFFISYQTIIGYQGKLGNCRLQNRWGPTTGKHIREMEIHDYPIVTDEELAKRQLDALVDTAVHELGADRFAA